MKIFFATVLIYMGLYMVELHRICSRIVLATSGGNAYSKKEKSP
jgi:hypothetical protein